jgi:hypothetical protein
VVDTYGSDAFGFLHVSKQPEAAVAVVHNDVLPFYEQFQQKWEPVLRPELRLNKEIEQFQQKWEPVLRPELRLNKEIEQFQQKWEPVLRPELRPNKEIEHFW